MLAIIKNVRSEANFKVFKFCRIGVISLVILDMKRELKFEYFLGKIRFESYVLCPVCVS